MVPTSIPKEVSEALEASRNMVQVMIPPQVRAQMRKYTNRLTLYLTINEWENLQQKHTVGDEFKVRGFQGLMENLSLEGEGISWVHPQECFEKINETKPKKESKMNVVIEEVFKDDKYGLVKRMDAEFGKEIPDTLQARIDLLRDKKQYIAVLESREDERKKEAEKA